MRLDWLTHGALVETGHAMAFGYYTHNLNLRKAVEKVVEITEDADEALQIVSAESFRPVEGKHNWLFTMFEGEDLPDFYLENINKADSVLVPSFWVKSVFIKNGVTRPIYVVPHGVDPVYEYRERKLPPKGGRFRYLWVGAPNNRKGYEEITYAWEQLGFGENDSVELYLKSTGLKLDRDVVEVGNATIDNRMLEVEELVELYHSAHCFVLPTRGEGFGLTLAEAMRTGLPSICTLYSGVTEFFDPSVGFALDYISVNAEFSFPGIPGKNKIWTRLGIPDMKALCDALLYVPTHWDEAVETAKAGSERIANKFTWERSAELLVAAMKKEKRKREG